MKLYGTLLLVSLAPLLARAESAPAPVSPALAAQPASETPDPAEELLKIAALKSPELLKEELLVAQADAFRFRGWRQYMPYLYANWQVGYFSLLASDDPQSKTGSGQFGGSFTLGANYPIYAWGAIEAEKKFTFARENMAKSHAVMTWRALVRTIRETLCDAVVAKANIALLEKKASASKRVVARTEQEFALGRIVASERAAKLLASRDAALEYNNEKIKLAGILTNLRSLTGAEDYGLADVPADLPDIDWRDADLDSRLAEFKKSGVDETPEADSARYEREMYREQRTIAEARELPIFNLGTSVTQQPVQTNGTFGMQTVVFAGLTGSWNIFDRDTTKESIRAQILGERLVETRLKFSNKQRLGDLDAAVQKLKSARESRDLRRDIVSLQDDACRVLEQRKKLGLVDEDDVEAGQIKRLEAKLALTRNRADILKAYHAFMSGLQMSPSDRYYSAPSNER